MQMNQCFPTMIGEVHNDIDYKLTQHCLDLKSRVESGGNGSIASYNTFNTHDIMEDEKFNDINNWVTEQVEIYAKTLGYCSDVGDASGWLTMANVGERQDIHNHARCHFSCVYYLEGSEDDAALVFGDRCQDMFPMAVETHTLYNAIFVKIGPKKGNLVIFPAGTPHRVEEKVLDGLRIALVYNFIQKEIESV